MSDLTFGVVQDVAGLIWGAPVHVSNRALSGVLRSGYDLIVNDMMSLSGSPLDRLEGSPRLSATASVIRDRGLNLVGAAGLGTPALRHVAAPVSVNPGSPTDTVRSWANMLGLQDAPAVVARSHDLLTRSQLSCLRAELLVPNAPALASARRELGAADAAIGRGDLDAALTAAQAAMQAADALEEQIARASAVHMARARQSADAIARAGALWTGLHTQDGALTWLAKNAREPLEDVARRLRDARAQYAAQEFDGAAELARGVERDLGDLIEQAFAAIAVKQRDHMALEAAKTLHQMGYEARAVEVDDRRVISALRDGRLMLTIGFDTQGRFEIDSRSGHEGGPACSVAVNDILQALAEKMRLEVEGRTFVGAADGDPARATRTSTNRRRLTAADMLANVERRSTVTSPPPQALAAAWATIAR